MAERRRPVGWYLDPDDPTSVRHWDGASFARFRSRPAWSLSADELVVDVDGRFGTSGAWSGPVTEGPARPAAEHAASAAFGTVADRPARGAMALPAGGTPAKARPRSPAGGAEPSPETTPPWVHSRRPLAVFAVIAALAVVTMVSTVAWPGAHNIEMPPASSAFVARASQTCQSVFGSPRTSTPSNPASLQASSAQVDGLANRLGGLADRTQTAAQVSGWLAGWHRYAADERRWASALAPPTAGPVPAAPGAPAAPGVTAPDTPTGTSTGPAGPGGHQQGPAGPGGHQQGPARPGQEPAPALAKTARADADRADNFALDSGLATCTLIPRGPSPAMSVSS